MKESETDPEDVILAQMGYKQELHRGFSNVMAISFCFTAVAVTSSISVLFSFGLQTGGPAVMLWGWIITSVFTLISGLALVCACVAVCVPVCVHTFYKDLVFLMVCVLCKYAG